MADPKVRCADCEAILARFPKVDRALIESDLEAWLSEELRKLVVDALNKLHQEYGTPPYFEINQDNKGD